MSHAPAAVEPEVSWKLLASAYTQGYFPMAPDHESRELQWFSPKRRGVIPLQDFRVSKNVLRALRNRHIRPVLNRDYCDTMRRCAQRDSTWISERLIELYFELHTRNLAHALEVWEGNTLLGGLYGVAIGGAFFGESMFQLAPEGHKFALYFCHQLLQQNNFKLWDTQYYTPHLGRFGCREVSDVYYRQQLDEALRVETAFALD